MRGCTEDRRRPRGGSKLGWGAGVHRGQMCAQRQQCKRAAAVVMGGMAGLEPAPGP